MPNPEYHDYPATDLRLTPPEDMQDMLGAPPGWLLRSGSGIVLMALALGLALCWMIRYPDKLEATAVITRDAPPLDVVAPASGYLDTLLVKEEQWARSGALLGVLNNPARWEDMQRIEVVLPQAAAALTSLTALENTGLPALPEPLLLGDLQSSYAAFSQIYRECDFYLRQTSTDEQIRSLEREVEQTGILTESYLHQSALFDQELALMKKDYQRAETLRREKVISDVDLETKESQLRQYERQREQMQSNLVQNRIRIEQLRNQQTALRRQREEGVATRRLGALQALDQLRGALAQWKKNYYLLAPADGRIIFEPGLAARQFQTAGETVFTLLPDAGGLPCLARCRLPAPGAGKIGVGSPVQIHLDAYPYKEYGAIAAVVTRIAPLPEADREGSAHYLVEASLEDPLRSTYGVEIAVRPEMTGRAFLLTNDRRLLERLFEQFLDLIKNR